MVPMIWLAANQILFLALILVGRNAGACPIAHCHQNMFHAWAAFERREHGFLSDLFENFTDPFNSAKYHTEFCRIFYEQQLGCLHRCTDTELDHVHSTTIWSLNRRAEWFNYHLNFTPKGMLEHYLFRRKPDLYMKPTFLRVICESPWLPTVPVQTWCLASQRQITNVSGEVERTIHGIMYADDPQATCVDFPAIPDKLANWLAKICKNGGVRPFYCHYYAEILRLEFAYKFGYCDSGCPPLNETTNAARLVNVASGQQLNLYSLLLLLTANLLYHLWSS